MNLSYFNYADAYNNLIDHCINESKQHPFDTYKIIVDDPDLLEEAFFKQYHALFQIEFLDFNQCVQELIENHNLLKYHQITKLEKMLLLDSFIDPNTIFYNENSRFSTIKSLLELFDSFDLSNITAISSESLPTLEKQKIETCLTLYSKFKHAMKEDQCLSYLDVIMNHTLHADSSMHYYFFTKQTIFPKIKSFITYLSKYYECVIYPINNTLQKHLNHIDFLETNYVKGNSKYQGKHPFSMILEPTYEDEIRQVLLHIYKQVIDENKRFDQFAIYYPNQTYLDKITSLCKNMGLPYDLHIETTSPSPIHSCLAFLSYCQSFDIQDLFTMLDYQCIYYNFSLESVKKEFLQSATLKNSFINWLDTLTPYVKAIRKETTLLGYASRMMDFIDSFFIDPKTKEMTRNFFDTLTNYQNNLTFDDFCDLILLMKPINVVTKKPQKNTIYLLNYQQPYSQILKTDHVFLTGCNESVVPNVISDEGILLDKDKALLPGLLTLLDLKKIQENQILQVLSNNHQNIVLSRANGSLQGETLLDSSVLLRLLQIFDIKKETHIEEYLHPAFYDFFYLENNSFKDKEILNHMIQTFIKNRNQPEPISKKPISVLSASQLETYNSCSYKYFHQYGLKIEPFASYYLQNNELGSLIHHILETHKDIFTHDTWNEDKLKNSINQHIDDYINQNELLKKKLRHPFNQYFVACLKDDLILTMHILYHHQKASNYKLKHSELKVYQKYPEFNIQGYIDRIDQLDDHVVVMDYKSSAKNLDLDLVKQGFHIQMLLYLDMYTKRNQLKKGAVLYFNTKKQILKSKKSILDEESADNLIKLYKMNGFINKNIIEDLDTTIDGASNIIPVRYVKKDQDYKGSILDDQEFDDLLSTITNHIKELYDQMKNGHFDIAPKGSKDPSIHHLVNPCSYCNYHSLCNYDVFYNEFVEMGGEANE